MLEVRPERAAIGVKRAGGEFLRKRRMGKDGAIARILTDPKAMLDQLSKQPPGSRGVELLTTKLLQMGAISATKTA